MAALRRRASLAVLTAPPTAGDKSVLPEVMDDHGDRRVEAKVPDLGRGMAE